ncbi:tRNA (guanine(10)-N(2))-dimethyltransferase [Thermococcus sp. Bubb.Bath]|uniref:tRNA (guanine(10)-N(2))-dimethyltransferase n=1 Tax=Thermococcus sp. Bubb.Bath TaxID=1638242 RepID=UPI00143B476F|nr:tRNA (guanine(10)-N(2))-dimethyltransferase [Thermococcus sp. Bubb.Bath]
MEIVEVAEGLARLKVPLAGRIYDSPVFYNPLMRLNRDISVFAVKTLAPRKVLDAFSATGVRGIRYALETPVEEVWLNDLSEEAFGLILQNIELNFGVRPVVEGDSAEVSVDRRRILVRRSDANALMSAMFRYFDFVDLDPFGSPAPFLDSALRTVRRKGILGITATDTGVLCGAYRNACRRKYLAEPLRGELCHEVGLRILIGTVVRYAAKYDMGIKVLLAYYRDHYFRVFLKVVNGARKADESLSTLGYLWQDESGKFEYSMGLLPTTPGAAGPLWLGPLEDDAFVQSLHELSLEHPLGDLKTTEFLSLLSSELDVPFYYDTHALARRTGVGIPKLQALIDELLSRGYRTTRTHFSPTSIKTEAPFEEVLSALEKVNNQRHLI